MGHFIFIILHFIALLYLSFGLIITIPLHILYTSQNKRNELLKEQTRIMRGEDVVIEEVEIAEEVNVKSKFDYKKVLYIILIILAFFIIDAIY